MARRAPSCTTNELTVVPAFPWSARSTEEGGSKIGTLGLAGVRQEQLQNGYSDRLRHDLLAMVLGLGAAAKAPRAAENRLRERSGSDQWTDGAWARARATVEPPSAHQRKLTLQPADPAA